MNFCFKEFPYLGGYAVQGANHRIPVHFKALQMTYRAEWVREQGPREREEMRHVGDRNLAIQHSTMWSKIKQSVLGPKRLIYFFMNNIFNLKGNCVLRTLKNSFAIF